MWILVLLLMINMVSLSLWLWKKNKTRSTVISPHACHHSQDKLPEFRTGFCTNFEFLVQGNFKLTYFSQENWYCRDRELAISCIICKNCIDWANLTLFECQYRHGGQFTRMLEMSPLALIFKTWYCCYFVKYYDVKVAV